MENNKLTNISIDTLWYLTKEEVDFFNKKASLTFVIYSEILSNLHEKNTGNLSVFGIKKIFENIVVSPFLAALEGAEMATKYNTYDANTRLDETKLNFRGLARTRIIMGIVNREKFDRKKNNDKHFAVSGPLQNFTLENTSFERFSLFEILAEFIENRPQLFEGDEKMIAHSFINSDQYSPVMSALNDAFELYFANLITKFEQETNTQGASKSLSEMAYKIYRSLCSNYSRYDFNSKEILSSEFVQNLISNYCKQ